MIDTAQLPHDTEAERSVLGSIFLDENQFGPVSSLLGPDDFFDADHSTLFRAMVGLHAESVPLDATTIFSVVKDDITEAAPLIASIAQAVPSTNNAGFYANAVRKHSLSRQAILIGGDLIKGASNGRPIADVLEDAKYSLAEIQCSISASSGSGIEFVSADDLAGDVAVDYIWQGWAARGHISLLIGLWKAGKTTLLSHLLHATADGGDVGGKVNPCKAVVVTEESSSLWKRRRDDLGIGGNVEFVIRQFKSKPTLTQWSSFVEGVADHVIENDVGLVVFDTWQSVSPVRDENDASATMAACLPLHRLTEAGAAVLLLHHPRKGGGNEATASRGSGALTGFVDLIVELRRYDPERPDDCKRVLRGYSRFEETPTELVVELRDDGYHVVGTRSDATRVERLTILETIVGERPGFSAGEIRCHWSSDCGIPQPSLKTIRRDLAEGVKQGLWIGEGDGKMGNPVTYSLVSVSTRAPK